MEIMEVISDRSTDVDVDHLQVGEEAEEAVLSVLSAEDFITVPGGGKNAFVQQSLRSTVFHAGWRRDPPLHCLALVPGHPCSGAVAMSDVKLRLSYTIHNTEGGKKVTAAVTNTGRAGGDLLLVGRDQGQGGDARRRGGSGGRAVSR